MLLRTHGLENLIIGSIFMQIFSVYEWIITFDVFDSFGKRINNDKPLFLGPEKYL